MLIRSQVESAFKFLRRPCQPVACTQPVVYLMRGLPGSGKSHRAQELAGTAGVICETDEYLRNCESERNFDEQLQDARHANLSKFRRCLEQRRSPIVVDRGNGLNEETYAYVEQALKHGYQISLQEPTSPWWREIQTLLRYRPTTDALLKACAEQLAEISRDVHGVPAETILDWLDGWVADLSTEDLVQSTTGSLSSSAIGSE